MAGEIVPIILSVVIVSLVSFAGVVTISLRKKSLNKLLLFLIAFSAGTLIGSSIFGLIPEAVEIGGSLAFQWIAGGIVLFFVIERFIHWHHHHHHGDHAHHHEGKVKPFAYLNLVGEVMHNFLDGTIIAASYLISIELGIFATIAIIFHEIPQEISDFGILIYGGFPVKKALLYNFLVALTAIVGAVVTFFTIAYVQNMSLILLSLAGGGFLYIALANLMPELHQETNTKKLVIQSVFLLTGILLMYYFGIVFPG